MVFGNPPGNPSDALKNAAPKRQRSSLCSEVPKDPAGAIYQYRYGHLPSFPKPVVPGL
jgi:hypothetical protein